MILSDDQIEWFGLFASDYEESISVQIVKGEILIDEIEEAKFEVKTIKDIREFLNETRKVRNFDGWETIVPPLPMH